MYDDSILRETARRSRQSARNAEIMLNVTFGLFAVTILTVLGILIFHS